MVRQVKDVFLGFSDFSHATFLRGPDISVPKTYWDSLHAEHSLCEIWRSNYIRRNFLPGRPPLLPWPKNFVSRMLTRDLFAVADLLVYLCQGGYAFVFVGLSVSRITKKFSTSFDETICTGETCD